MRLVTFRHRNTVRTGILEGDATEPDHSVIDLAHPAMQEALAAVVPQVDTFLDTGWDGVVDGIRRYGNAPEARIAFRDVELLAPIRHPKRIFGIAHNYRDALAERGMPAPAEPVLFMKHGSTVIGPDAAVVLPKGVGGVTYEAEIAAVIGRRARNVTAEAALDYVAGYAVFNDVSASEMIREDKSFDRGKNLPTFGPFGPFLATADEIPDPQQLGIGLTIEGKRFQESSTSQMLFSVADLIAILSRQGDLLPGDVIATGTPAGVAPVQNPPTWIKPGTVMTAWVQGLGFLNNPVVEGPAL